MKHIPLIMLSLCFLLIMSFGLYFYYNLFVVNKSTIIFFNQDKTLQDTSQNAQKNSDNNQQTSPENVILSGVELWEKGLHEDFKPEIKNIEEVIDEYDKKVELNPDDIENNYALGYLNLVKGNNAVAKKYFDEVIKMDKKNKSAKLALANLYLKVKKPVESITIINELETINPNDNQIWFCKAIYYESIKDNKNAVLYYSKVLNKDRTNKRAKDSLLKLNK
ncbi:MAG: tetratricopeptide repeat protein [Cyanobacteriota bacterium]